MPKYTPLNIADYFLIKAKHAGQGPMPNLKLQRMVCYAQTLYLDIHREPIFEEEIEVRKEGPILASLCKAYEAFGAEGISANESFDPTIIDRETAKLLDAVYAEFLRFYGGPRNEEGRERDGCEKTASTDE